MSAADETTVQHVDGAAPPGAEADVPVETIAASAGDVTPPITLELALQEAEALHAWLLKPASDGSTSLDDPFVSRVLSRLGLALDAAHATVSVRQELVQAGISTDHLSDDEVRALAKRIADAASASIRG